MKYLSALNIITVLLHLTIDGCMPDFVCTQLVTKFYSQNIFHNFFLNEGFSNKQSIVLASPGIIVTRAASPSSSPCFDSSCPPRVLAVRVVAHVTHLAHIVLLAVEPTRLVLVRFFGSSSPTILCSRRRSHAWLGVHHI